MIKQKFLALLIALMVFPAMAVFAQTDNSSPTKVTGKSKSTASGTEYWDHGGNRRHRDAGEIRDGPLHGAYERQKI